MSFVQFYLNISPLFLVIFSQFFELLFYLDTLFLYFELKISLDLVKGTYSVGIDFVDIVRYNFLHIFYSLFQLFQTTFFLRIIIGLGSTFSKIHPQIYKIF